MQVYIRDYNFIYSTSKEFTSINYSVDEWCGKREFRRLTGNYDWQFVAVQKLIEDTSI